MMVELVLLTVGLIVLIAVVFAIVRIVMFAYDADKKFEVVDASIGELEDKDSALWSRLRNNASSLSNVSNNVSSNASSISALASRVSGISFSNSVTGISGAADVSGNLTVRGATAVKGGTSAAHNASNLMTVFADGSDGKNRVRGDTIVFGNVDPIWGNIVVEGVSLFKRDVNMASLTASNILLGGGLTMSGSFATASAVGSSNTFGGTSRFAGDAEFGTNISVSSNLCMGPPTARTCMTDADLRYLRFARSNLLAAGCNIPY